MGYTEKKERCPHNDGLWCFPSKRNCDTCGWNPEVAKARLERFCRKNNIPLPTEKKEEAEE